MADCIVDVGKHWHCEFTHAEEAFASKHSHSQQTYLTEPLPSEPAESRGMEEAQRDEDLRWNLSAVRSPRSQQRFTQQRFTENSKSEYVERRFF